MEITRRSFVAASAAALAGTALAGMPPAAELAHAGEPGTFVGAISFMPTSCQPSSGGNDDQTLVVRPVFEGLFQEVAGGYEYHLADSVQISEDGLVYTIHIRDNADWSDGEPVTVDDILFTIAYNARNYGGVSSSNSIDGEMCEFAALDPKTLQITLPKVWGTYIQSVQAWTPLPSHVFDGDYMKVDENPEYFITPGFVCSGPYTLSQVNEDSLVYTARPDFYNGEPQVKTLVLKTIGAGVTRQLAFENGEIDYMRITTVEEIEHYASQPDKYNMYSISEARLNYLQLNMNGPVISQLGDDARKAIFLAMDAQQIIDFAYGTDKLAVPANSFFNPEQAMYNPQTVAYSQDLETAKALAESSGLAGQTLTYIYNADRANMEAVAVVIQQQLSAIGVNLQIEGLDSRTFFSRFFYGAYGTDQGNTWDLGTNGWDSERGASARQAYSYLSQGQYRLCSGFAQETCDKAVQANGTADPAEANALWDEVVNEALSQYWEYPLTYTNYIMVSHKNVTGLDASPIVPEFSRYDAIVVE